MSIIYRTNYQEYAKVANMTMDKFPIGNELEKELLGAEFSGLCFEMLNNTIPKKFGAALKYEKAIEKVEEDEDMTVKEEFSPPTLNTGVDSTYISYDYKFEGLTSYRLRLVPRPLKAPCKDGVLGEVNEVVINLPDAFINDIEAVDDFQLAIITVYGNEPITNQAYMQSFVLGDADIVPYANFDDIDLAFITDEKNKINKNGWTVKIDCHPEEDNHNEKDECYQELLEKRDLARSIFRIISEYRLGNQSRNDGTM